MDAPKINPIRKLNDERGFFEELFRLESLPELHSKEIQCNHSYSTEGVIRGLHFSKAPTFKIVRVIQGQVLDCVVDLRRNSTAFGLPILNELSENKSELLIIPPGFAHAFQVLSKSAHLIYFVNHYYNPQDDFSINPLDNDLSIPWHSSIDLKISKKDKEGIYWKNFCETPAFEF